MSKNKTNPADIPSTPAETPTPTPAPVVDVNSLAQAFAQAIAAVGNSNADKLSTIAETLQRNAPVRKVTIAELLAKRPKRKAKLHGDFYQHGQQIFERQVSDEEIKMLNQLQPGTYIQGWVTVERKGPDTNPSTYIHWPCDTVDKRLSFAALAPNFYSVLKQIVDEQEAQKKAIQDAIDEGDAEKVVSAVAAQLSKK